MTDFELVHGAAALIIGMGEKPSVRRVAAVLGAAHGKRAMRWTTIAAALKVLPGNTSGNTAATAGQQFDEAAATAGQHDETATCASADHNGVIVDSAQGVDGIPYPLTTFGDVPPQDVSVSEPVPAVADTPAPALFAVPEIDPDAKPKAKPARLRSAYAGSTLESFGQFTPSVHEVLANDGFAVGTKAMTSALESLAMWRATCGDAAFGHGLAVAMDRRMGHRYAGGVMRKYDPERDRAPLRVAAAIDGPAIIEGPKDAPQAIDLIAAARAAGKNVPPLEIPPWERPPWHPEYQPRSRQATA